MGYRSEVALCLSPKVELPLAVEAAMKEVDFIREGAFEGSRLFICHSVKWYTDYSEIEVIDEFIHSLEEEDYVFMRIGEDLTDTEYQGAFFDNPFDLGIVREFNYEGIDDTLP